MTEQNITIVIGEQKEILARLVEVLQEDHSNRELSNGHDLAEILFIICKKGLKSSNKLIQDTSTVKGMLRLAYGREHFATTCLFHSFIKLQTNRDINIFNSIENVT